MRRSTHVRLAPCGNDFSTFRSETRAPPATGSGSEAAGWGLFEKNDMVLDGDCTPLTGGRPPLAEGGETPPFRLRIVRMEGGPIWLVCNWTSGWFGWRLSGRQRQPLALANFLERAF